MKGNLTMNLCLLAHCLSVPTSTPPLTHPELFIPLGDVEELLEQLAAEQFEFCLPGSESPASRKTCSFTFDDGYANNLHFLPLAEKFQLPFVLFLSSINIAEQLPFLWDIESLTRSQWRFWEEDYRSAYRSVDAGAKEKLLQDENHRPLTLAEMQTLSENCWAHFGLHTHSHQPLVGRFLAQAALEITENSRFLAKYPRVLNRDLALPCGFYTHWTAKYLLKNLVDRVYTVDGGATRPGSPFIHRVTLVNPTIGGDLRSQISNSFSRGVKLRRKMVNLRYSLPLLSRF